MITLVRGNRLPTVAVFQSFLNQRGEADIKVDGIFGRETRAAIRDYQHRIGVSRSGRVNHDLWRRIVGRDWQIIDSVDLADTETEDDQDLAPFGQTVIRQYGMSGGGRRVIYDIITQANSGRVVLLRFHGHGSPGVMAVAEGVDDHYSNLGHFYGPSFDTFLRQLQPIFAPFGSIEMHGCRVGAGRRGRALLTRMASATQVPVTAGRLSQYGGGNSTFRFEGPTRTVCPNGHTLKEWARRNCRATFA